MLQETILDFMRHEAYRPLSAEDLAEALDLKGSVLEAFWTVLNEMEKSAQIIRTRYDKFGVPERMNLVVGRLSVTGKGFGFVIPEPRLDASESDVFIPLSGMLSAMHNDRVVARVHRLGGNGKTREGEVIRIVERANRRIVGTFESSKSFGFVVPDDPKIGQDIFIPRQHFNGAKIGAKVVVEITKWPESRRSAEGKITEALGYLGDPGIDVLTVIKKYDLPIEFPPKVLAEAEKVPECIEAGEISDRRDLRELSIVTIDGDDAKDLDDGVYVERRGSKYFLGVYIADVSHYVKENAPLDIEAKERGTSVYLVDRVLPMLPKRLSNGICSLNAGEDRLAMAAQMEIDEQGTVVDYEIFPAVIRVYRRLTYNIVRKILVEKDAALRDDNADLLPMLEELERLCHILRQRRMRRGAIDFDLPEIKVRLDEKGVPVKLVKRERNLAESIIEECMLIANETVAEHLERRKDPALYRVHEEPEAGKLEKLNALLATFRQTLPHLKEGETVQPSSLQQVLKSVAGRPEERIISTVMLRSMKQARYEAKNLGHFGLAAKYYTHFTSPIRRYPDLIVHRMLKESLRDNAFPAKRREKLKMALPEIALSSSQRERTAAEAERETTEMKKIEYMQPFVGEEFEGIVSGVTAFGLFVELENGVEGLVRVSSMENDYYQYVEEQYALIGERTRQTYRLGDAVRVILVQANIESRTIDFILADNGTFCPEALQKKQHVIHKEAHSVKKESKSQEKKKGNKKKKQHINQRDAQGIQEQQKGTAIGTKDAKKKRRKKKRKNTGGGAH